MFARSIAGGWHCKHGYMQTLYLVHLCTCTYNCTISYAIYNIYAEFVFVHIISHGIYMYMQSCY